MVATFLRGISIVALMILSNCGGTGEVVNVDIHTIQPSSAQATVTTSETPRVMVKLFEDSRQNKDIIGKRTHFWGGTTQFNAWNGQLGDGMAQMAVEYFRQHGWLAIKAGTNDEASGGVPDVTLSGKLLDFDVLAKSRFGSTKIDANVKIGFVAENRIDGSTVRIALGASAENTVLWFDRQDVEELVNEVVKETFTQLLQGTQMEGSALRLKSGKA